jgi:two-component system, NarL family, sensor histidine kinase UhpB
MSSHPSIWRKGAPAPAAPTRIIVGGEVPGRLPPVVDITLYRIAQEALNNVVKHARASRASIELQTAAERISCIVRDDGIGFAAELAHAPDRLGLLIIRERLNALGGTLRLASGAGCGTTVCAEIPQGR